MGGYFLKFALEFLMFIVQLAVVDDFCVCGLLREGVCSFGKGVERCFRALEEFEEPWFHAGSGGVSVIRVHKEWGDIDIFSYLKSCQYLHFSTSKFQPS
jgi:hypothetical protein